MQKRTKIWLIVAALLVISGLIIFSWAMTAYKWDFSKLSTVQYETNIHTINREFSNISISTDTASILFAASQDGHCKIVCYEPENRLHSVDVKDGTLSIQVVDEREWYEYIGITFVAPKITVYLPENQYASLLIKGSTGDIEIPKDCKFKSMDIAVSTGVVANYASVPEFIKIQTNTGSIRLESVSAGELDLTVATGKVTVSNVACAGSASILVSTGKTEITNFTCMNLISDGSTGDIVLNHVIATEMFSIVRSTGDIILDRCDAAKFFLKTNTGDVTGSILTDKVFITTTDTGSVRVPNTITGGKCQIISNTGDIRITIN